MDKSDHSFKKPYPVTSQRRKGRVTRLLENGHTSAVFQIIYERTGPLPDLLTPLDTKDQSTPISTHTSPPTSINTPLTTPVPQTLIGRSLKNYTKAVKLIRLFSKGHLSFKDI